MVFVKSKVLRQLKIKDMSEEELIDNVDESKKRISTCIYTLLKTKFIEQLEDKKYRIIKEPTKGKTKEEMNLSKIDPIIIPKEEIIKTIKEEPPKLGLSEQVAELNEKIDFIANIKNKEAKKFKLKGFTNNKLKRYNKGKSRACLMLRRQGAAELVKGEFMQGMIKIGENYYDGSAMYTWLFKRFNKLIPFYIIPEWSIRPLCREEIYEKSLEENTLIDSQVITIRAIKLEQVGKEGGKKLGGMGYVGIVIAVIVAVYLMFSGGGN